MENNKENLEKCRNCTYDVQNGIRRCPYCGILNPTLKIKEVFFGIFATLFVMAIYTYFIQ